MSAETPGLTRDQAAWWCPACEEAFELGEAAFYLTADSPPLCPNDGCKSELEGAQ